MGQSLGAWDGARQMPMAMPSRRDALSAALAACALLPAANALAVGAIEVRDDLQAAFKGHGASGAFALLDAVADRITLVNRARAELRLTPASTFKIANSLIALETGVVKDENEIIPYGGGPQPIKAWERDMSMRDAIAVSNVPVYQNLARRIGRERYVDWLARLDYGSRQIGAAVDRFWLDGSLQISAIEQARFLAALAARRLPLSDRSQATVADIMRQRPHKGADIHAKTGWAIDTTPGVGWWVGWTSKGGRVRAFALNIETRERGDVDKRIPLALALLEALDAFA